jgi:cytochrome P450
MIRLLLCGFTTMDSLSEEQLYVACMDYMLPATTTVTATLNFAMAFLLNYPEVQAKMQEELDAKVGRDRLPNLDDRARLVNGTPRRLLVRHLIPSDVTNSLLGPVLPVQCQCHFLFPYFLQCESHSFIH